MSAIKNSIEHHENALPPELRLGENIEVKGWKKLVTVKTEDDDFDYGYNHCDIPKYFLDDCKGGNYTRTVDVIRFLTAINDGRISADRVIRALEKNV